MTLRSKLIRIAHENPQFRAQLLPLIKEAAEPSLNDAEMDALKAVAKAKGRNWKGWLMDQWPSSKYPGFEGDITAQLQSIRNKIGPSGLKKIKLASEVLTDDEIWESDLLTDAEIGALKVAQKKWGKHWRAKLNTLGNASKHGYSPKSELPKETETLVFTAWKKLGPEGLGVPRLKSWQGPIVGLRAAFEKSAGAKGSIESHIEMGMVAIAKEVRDALDKEFKDSITFREPSTTMRNSAAFEGDIAWQGDDSGKMGFILVVLEIDQFDLQKGNVHLNMNLPNGKRMQKDFGLPSGWMSKSPEMLGREIANVLGKNWIDPFFGAASVS